MTLGWRPLAAALAEDLAAGGAVTDPRWAAAVRDTARHVFVPRFFDQHPDLSGWQEVSRETDPDRWVDAVYSDRTLVTAVRSRPDVFDGFPVPVSSSTRPSLMLRMLHVLNVEDGMDVVEIGTGTGYNAALLCARLGDRRVVSVDVEPGLVPTARERLAGVGERPRPEVVDASGWEPPAFDRLIATCGVRAVAPGWVRAARRQAVLVVPLTGSPADGGLVRLVADGAGAAHGRFASFHAGFMPLRSAEPPEPYEPPEPAATGPERERRVSRVDPALLGQDRPLAMLAQLRLPRMAPRRTGTTEDGRPVTILRARDGSWVRAEHLDDGGAVVRSGGPADLWRVVEDAHDRWTAASRPGWERFGLSVTPNAQTVWLDEPDTVIA